MDSIVKLTLIIFTLIFTGNSYALGDPLGFKSTVKTVSGATTSFKYVSGGRIYTKVLNLGKLSLGAAIRKRAFSPWGLAITALITAAGYYLDSQTGGVTTDGSTVTGYWYSGLYGTPKSQDPDALVDYIATIVSGQVGYTVTVCSMTYDSVNNRWNYVIAICTNEGPVGTLTSNSISYSTGTASLTPIQITDLALYDELEPQLSDDNITDVLIDPQTSYPDITIPEVSQAITDIETEIALLNDADTTNDPLVQTQSVDATSEQIAQSLNDSLTSPETQPATVQVEDMCEANPNSLACLDVGTELPTTTVVPEYDVPYSVSLFGLTSNTVCPAPIIVPLTLFNSVGVIGKTIEVSYSQACTLATTLNPLIIAAGVLVSFYVVGGSNRGTA